MVGNNRKLKAVRVIDSCTADDIVDAVMNKGKEGYRFIAAHLTHPRCCTDVADLVRKAKDESGGPTVNGFLPAEVVNNLSPPVGITDYRLSPRFWRSYVIGRLSQWIDPDSNDSYIRQLSEKALLGELSYFRYLNVGTILVRLRGTNHTNLARLISQHLNESPRRETSIWAIVPAVLPPSTPPGLCNGAAIPNGKETSSGDESTENVSANIGTLIGTPTDLERADPWRWFSAFRRSCDNDPHVGVCLELTEHIPDSGLQSVIISRWKGEPLRALLFNTQTFDVDRSTGMPILRQGQQNVAKELFIMNPCAVIQGPQLHSRRPGATRRGMPRAPRSQPSPGRQLLPGEQRTPPCVYFECMENIYNEHLPLDVVAEYAQGYEDVLQVPLQPLSDNLESQTYENFEKDPIKYKLYAQAFELALNAKRKDSSSPLIVMVLGAGRGPLVTGCLEMINKHRISDFKLIAVEKNPNAVVTLKTKQATEWDNQVEVIFSDMRDYKPTFKADIVVSELLGSFGDNELSPECLDGALHLMKDDCTSIPNAYSSFIAPIHSPKLFSEVRSTCAKGRFPNASFETGYVVRMVNRFEIAAPKELFSFRHPNFALSTHDRFKEVHFTAREDAEVMGFVGYFSADLFDNSVVMSILPETHTPGLFSWFPILLPIPVPVFVEKGETIRMRVWRLSNKQQVWYEWQLVEPVLTPILNSGGKPYGLRLK